MVDSTHGSSAYEEDKAPLDLQRQLFASAGAIRYPIEPETEAWKEKVRFPFASTISTL